MENYGASWALETTLLELHIFQILFTTSLSETILVHYGVCSLLRVLWPYGSQGMTALSTTNLGPRQCYAALLQIRSSFGAIEQSDSWTRRGFFRGLIHFVLDFSIFCNSRSFSTSSPCSSPWKLFVSIKLNSCN